MNYLLQARCRMWTTSVPCIRQFKISYEVNSTTKLLLSNLFNQQKEGV